MSPKVLIALLLAAISVSPALAQTRQQTIRERSTHVMPFSMDATMHQFEPTKTGGFMAVTVHDGDARQVALVRSHLQKEAAAFARGDFGDPAYIHGKNMPGLASLSAGAKRISVHYAPLSDGATITFRTSDAGLIAALHRWFAAQVSDHGHDAMM
ncbi:MAG TPA: hypothetical protein VFW34_07480 [Candidatus Rubrimentiphilum sp.]|nr:hypothetical protein [Candidatus Rubrimentiphilum sp.]